MVCGGGCGRRRRRRRGGPGQETAKTHQLGDEPPAEGAVRLTANAGSGRTSSVRVQRERAPFQANRP